jgi:hypothetical protein
MRRSAGDWPSPCPKSGSPSGREHGNDAEGGYRVDDFDRQTGFVFTDRENLPLWGPLAPPMARASRAMHSPESKRRPFPAAEWLASGAQAGT